MFVRSSWSKALLLLALAACGGDDKGASSPASETKDASVIDAGSTLDAANQTNDRVLRGTVLDLASMAPLPGVRVRILERPEFGETTSNAQGDYELADVPDGEEVVLQFEAEGMYPMLSHVIVVSPNTREFGPLLMFSASGALLFMRASGELVEGSLGTVGGVFQDISKGSRHGVAGATFSIAPSSGNLVYLGENDVPEPSRVTTASDGAAAAINVSPGLYVVGFEAPGFECHTTSGETLDGTRITRRVRVLPGHFANFGAITCQ